jgi:polyhydroxyalkanoate synthesis regulator phasin
MFQPNDAGGIINATYDRMEHIMEVKRTYDDMIKKGETAEARAFLQENVNEIASASIAGNAKTQLFKITQAMNICLDNYFIIFPINGAQYTIEGSLLYGANVAGNGLGGDFKQLSYIC